MGLVVRGSRMAKGFNDQSRIEISTAMQGNVVFKETVDVYMNAHFKGTLEFCGTLTVGEHAELEADIRGDIVIVSGRVYGNITAHKLLVLMPPAVVHGNIAAPKLNIVEGAVFQGNCQMTEDLLDITEVSRYLEIDMKEIEALANSGKIPGRREVNSWKFQRSQIDHWASSGKIS